LFIGDEGDSLHIRGIVDARWDMKDLDQLRAYGPSNFEFVDISSYQVITGDYAYKNMVSHVTWQGITQPSDRNQLPITITLKSGSTEYNFKDLGVDASGFFTVPVGHLGTGTWSWRVKGPSYLAKSGIVFLNGGAQTNVDMDTLRSGDANDTNVVNSVDFAIMNNSFGYAYGDRLYDPRADFNHDRLVNSLDFIILKTNFGQGGDPPI